MDQSAVVSLLSSWAAWSRSDTDTLGFKPAAGSAEGRFIPESGSVFDDDRRPHEVVISDDQGLRIDSAVISTGRVNAMLLVSVFIGLVPVSVAAHRLRLQGDPRLQLDAALRAVGDRLSGSPGSLRRDDRVRGQVQIPRAA